MPSVRGASPQTRRSPPTFSSRPCRPRPGTSAAAQARSTIYPLAMALRLSGQSVSRSTECGPGAIRQAGRRQERPGRGQLGVLPAHGLWRRPATRGASDFDPGIEGTAATVSPNVAGREDLEELGREAHRSPGRGLPPAELARAIISAEDQGQAIDLAENPILGPSCRIPVVGQDAQLERRAHHVLVEERDNRPRRTPDWPEAQQNQAQSIQQIIRSG